jgi:hypothetical protein
MAFEREYGFAEDGKTRALHSSRRMFCVREGALHIAEEGVPYSHAEWFEREGWMRDSGEMDRIVRGVVDSGGNLHFYAGWDFRVDAAAEKAFFPHLKELAERLHLKPTARVHGGMVKGKPGEQWTPKKSYGALSELLAK